MIIWGPEYRIRPIDMAIKMSNEFFIRELIEDIKDHKLIRAYEPRSALYRVDTGHVSLEAYGVYTRRVQMYLGGREGNNAFLADEDSENEDMSYLESEAYIKNIIK